MASTSNMTTPISTCQICEKSPSKYLCPRCGVPYCSLPCYKNETKHLQCSESFYKDCVVEQIKTEEHANPESAKKMQEVLQRFHQQYNLENQNYGEGGSEELDSDDDEPLQKRMEGIDLNDADAVWNNLTDEEKREFQSLAKNVDGAGDIIPEWIPWWNDEPEKTLVEEIPETNDEGTKHEHITSCSCPKLHKRQPDILNPIPIMTELTRVKPNQHVAKGLINVIASYVWTARLFNGDLSDPANLTEAASCIVHLSSFLKMDTVFKNVEHSMADVPLNACNIPLLSEGGTSIQAGLNRDVWIIIKGPNSVDSSSAKSYLLSALTECYTLILKTFKIMKSKNTSENLDKAPDGSFSKNFPSAPSMLSLDMKLLMKAKRKLLYLIAFANEYMHSMQLET